MSSGYTPQPYPVSRTRSREQARICRLRTGFIRGSGTIARHVGHLVLASPNAESPRACSLGLASLCSGAAAAPGIRIHTPTERDGNDTCDSAFHFFSCYGNTRASGPIPSRSPSSTTELDPAGFAESLTWSEVHQRRTSCRGAKALWVARGSGSDTRPARS